MISLASLFESEELLNEAFFKKWIPKNLKKGMLHKELGIPEDERIPKRLLLKKKKQLSKKAEKGKLSKKNLKTLRRVNLALNFREM
jgi:hypothetical protein